MVSTQRRSRSSRSDVARRSLMARIPVSGVRTSCANAASAVSTMPGPAVLAARLRALRAARPEARFFGGRLFGDRVVRCERDFGAMISLTLARLHHAMAGLRESRRSGFSPCDWPVASRCNKAGRPGGGCRPASRQQRGVRANRWPRSTSRVFAPRRRERGGGAGSRAPASRASCCSSRWTLVDQNRSCPRTTSVTPCSASSITTDK